MAIKEPSKCCRTCGAQITAKSKPSRPRQYCSKRCCGTRPRTKEPTDSRFWKFVDRADPTQCWEWQSIRGKAPDNYGRFYINGRFRPAHRIAYALTNGAIPPGMCVLQSCDNPPCVNPAHLSLGTNHDNLLDKHRKGRHADFRGEKSGTAKLTTAQVIDIRNDPRSCRILGTIYGVSKSTIKAARNGQNWSHL